MKRLNSLLSACIWLLLAIGTCYAGYRGWIWKGYTDFDVYWRAGERYWQWLQGDPVDFAVSARETSPFRYSPLYGWLFIPFSWLPLHVARALWMSLQWLVYAGTLKLVRRQLALSVQGELLVLLGTLRFAVDNSNIGQVSALLAALLTLAAFRSGWSGALAHALAVLLKAQPLALAAIDAIRRDIRATLRFMAALSVTLVLSYASFGARAYESWLSLLLRAESVLDPTTIGNQSLYGALLRTLPSRAVARGVFAALLFATALWVWRSWKRQRYDRLIGWAIGLALMPVFGILTWKNTYLSWILPLALFTSRSVWLATAVAAVFLIPSQGVIGADLNAWALRVGLLPWSALLSTLVGIHIWERRS